jgi:DNA polymerase (family 10)
MTNSEISKLLRNAAAAYSIKDEKKFRFQIIAYQKAADAIDHSTTELIDLFRENKLDSVPGIGPSIKSHLEELFTHGKVKHFEEILRDIPPAVFPLLDVPSFGPKKAYKLVSEYRLSNTETVISDLATIAKEGKIASLSGFGEKSQQDILEAIQEYWLGKTKTVRMVLPYANELAERIVSYLLKSKAVLKAYPLGSLRRRLATVGDIDIAVATREPELVLEYFAAYPGRERLIEQGDRTSSILASSGRQIDIMVQSPEGFGALLQHFTGSKAHNIHLREYALSKGLSLSEYGIRKKGEGNDKVRLYETEEQFYKALGLAWIPPEMREDTGEIELAIKHNLPKLVELSDIKGDFHLHSSYPIEPSHDMGQSSMEEMIKQAVELKYAYLGFSEHNPSLSRHNSEQSYQIIKKRGKFIDRLNFKYNKVVHIFSLLEIDILPNGELALDQKSLDLLDGAVVSIHSGFDMDRATMTKRVLKGLSNPKAKILAHPTGRLLNQRSGYDLDWEQVFAFCKKNNKALEINAWPLRLDLPDNLVREAVKQGVTLVIDTDSHAVSQMKLMEYGVSVARRGWAKRNDILNTMTYNEIIEWFRH